MNTKLNFIKSSLFWILIAAALAFLYGWIPVVSYDMASRALLGGTILADWSNMQYDHFTYTAAGTYYVNSEWLCDVIIYLLEKVVGQAGYLLFRVINIFFFGLSLILIIRLYTKNVIYIIFAVLMVFSVSADRFAQVGPALVTYALFGYYLYFWEVARLRNNSKFLYAIVPIHWFWFNCHGGALLGLGVIGAMAVGEVLGSVFKLQQDFNKKLVINTFIVIGLCLLVALINPYGLNSYYYSFEMVFGDMGSVVREVLIEWHPVISDYAKSYTMVLFLPLVLFGLAFSFIKAAHYFRLAHIFGLIPTLYLGFTGIREIPELATISVLVMSYNFFSNKQELGINKKRVLSGLILVLSIFLIGYAVLGYRAKYAKWDVFTIVETDFEPKEAVDFLDKNNIHGKGFNGFYTGPYLEVRRWPKDQVFVDGRLHLFDKAFHKQYFNLYKTQYPGEVFDKFDQKWNFDYVILSKRDVKMNPYLLEYFKASSGWNQVFEDAKGWVFLKNPKFLSID
ncbi:MAG: hypothetical protein ABH859_03880 [Pseudomonadota bacterium]